MSTETEHRSSLRQTGIPLPPADELTALLLKDPYRDMWGQFVQRRRGNGINIRAVATFMAYELSDTAGRELSPNYLKDSVRRALNNGVITDRIINRFIAAFGFTAEEIQRLWDSVVYHRKLSSDLHPVTSVQIERTTLAQTIILHCNEAGFTKTIEIVETFRVEHDELQYFKPIVEGQNIELEMISGGEISEVTNASAHMFKGPHNDVLGIWIKTPYVLKKGEIHFYRMRCHLTEDMDDGEPYNYFRVGASEIPKYNVTVIVNFSKPALDIKHCVWDGLEFKHPVIEEILPAGKLYYTSHYPIVYRAYCGFQWLVDPAYQALEQQSRNRTGGKRWNLHNRIAQRTASKKLAASYASTC